MRVPPNAQPPNHGLVCVHVLCTHCGSSVAALGSALAGTMCLTPCDVYFLAGVIQITAVIASSTRTAKNRCNRDKCWSSGVRAPLAPSGANAPRMKGRCTSPAQQHAMSTFMVVSVWMLALRSLVRAFHADSSGRTHGACPCLGHFRGFHALD
jgi:hypothetical protein